MASNTAGPFPIGAKTVLSGPKSLKPLVTTVAGQLTIARSADAIATLSAASRDCFVSNQWDGDIWNHGWLLRGGFEDTYA